MTKIRFNLRNVIAIAICLAGFFANTQHGVAQNSLIPDSVTANPVANYACTWNLQDWVGLHKSPAIRDALNHENLFGVNGWARTMWAEVRKDLIFLLDDGWDMPLGKDNGDFQGGHVLDDQKYPEYGDTPREKLKTLADNIRLCGWRGAGIWVCAQETKAYQLAHGIGMNEEYWRERLEWSRYAGINYWKIDWGRQGGNREWRQMITRLADEIYPELVIEHSVTRWVMNEINTNKRIAPDDLSNGIAVGSFSDVFRTYDVTGNLSIATTLDRVGEHLLAAYTDGQQQGLMTGEDEVYINAALGLSQGIMRYSNGDASAGALPNPYYGGDDNLFTQTRPIRKMLDEITRAVKWQRIAPPFRVDAYKTLLANEYLVDDWNYQSNNSWTGHTGLTEQRAPAAISRGIALPTVIGIVEEKPYLIASRNPNGAISLASFGRTHESTGYYPVYSDIKLEVGALTGKIGVFGHYQSLTLVFDHDLTGLRIQAQGLLAETVEDITSQVDIQGNTLIISKEVLERIGCAGSTAGDFSEPGMVIQIGEEQGFFPAPPLQTR